MFIFFFYFSAALFCAGTKEYSRDLINPDGTAVSSAWDGGCDNKD